MIACPECGRPLEPFELSSGDRTWLHKPHCWHPDTAEVYGVEMTLSRAIELARQGVEAADESLEHARGILAELEGMRLVNGGGRQDHRRGGHDRGHSSQRPHPVATPSDALTSLGRSL